MYFIIMNRCSFIMSTISSVFADSSQEKWFHIKHGQQFSFYPVLLCLHALFNLTRCTRFVSTTVHEGNDDDDDNDDGTEDLTR